MTAAWLLGWWNLIFIVPFGLALLYLGLYTVTGLDGDAGTDADADAAADADADADAGADHDADADHEHDLHHAEHIGPHGHGHDGPAPREVSLPVAMLTFIGVGRAPVGLVLMILLMTWGCIGFITNNVVRPLVPSDWMVALASLPLAGVGSVLFTSGMARLVARYMPSTETSAHKRRDLCGLVGEALYPITAQFGMAVVRDRHGNRFQVACHTGADGPTIGKGEPVLLVRFDESEQTFTVVPYEIGRDSVAGLTGGRTTIETRLETDAQPSLRATPGQNARELS